MVAEASATAVECRVPLIQLIEINVVFVRNNPAAVTRHDLTDLVAIA
jgi:hypothetical protein